jgi:hypothetical protein
MTLYEQALDLWERVGDLKGKSATLQNMGYVLETRGDLQGAMTRYEAMTQQRCHQLQQSYKHIMIHI